ncbi:MAG: chromosome segregation protein SMC, partial [Clostridia bacterium]|nr:chromosome segregation protein SMC [Clostridia bacterium]
IESIELITQNIETRRFSIEVDLASANDDILRLSSKCNELEQRRSEADTEVEKASDKVFRENKKFHSYNQKIAELKNTYNEMTKALGEKQGRLKMLEEMEEGLEGYARSVRDLLKAHKDGKYLGNIIGVLSKLIQVDKKYTTAIETALGNAMQNIVVKTEDDAKEAIEYLKINHLGRVTFLPVSSQEGRRLDNEDRVMQNAGAVSIASDVVNCTDEIKNIVQALLGRTVIMDNIDNAIALARATHYKFKIVTLSGELLQPGGSVTGGSVNKAQALLGRKDEIEKLKEECAKLARETEKLEDEIDEFSENAEKSRTAEGKLREELSDKENKAQKLKAEYEVKQSLLDVARKKLLKLQEEKTQISTQQTDTDISKTKLREVLESSDALISNGEETVRLKQLAVREATAEREKHSIKIIDKKMEINSAQKDIELADMRIADIQRSVQHSMDDLNERKENKRLEEQNIKELESQIDSSDMRAKQCLVAIESLKDEIKNHMSGRSGSDTELEELRSKIKELNEKILTMQSEVMRIEAKKNKIDEDLENAAKRLWDDYELTYNTALELKKDIGSLSEAQKQIAKLKGDIKALGNINVDSIEEYKEVKDRYEFLSGQVNDMEKAKNDLEKLIDEMMTVMRAQFAEKFEVINQLFMKSFVDLFGGGKAEVKLLNPLDTLESPIEIEVQPPGKKLQSITLLSGGEHALTAIALLFALLQVSPAPFLVLDEIEAALDDENVYRFGDYIRNYGNNTQFVVITHRRGTMEAADVLYGVTMQEKGVSRLLTMKLEDVEFEE